MCLETAQLLSTAVHYKHIGPIQNLYKPCYINHPSNIWARASKENFEWLYLHGISLCNRYYRDYKKVHKSESIIRLCGHYNWCFESKGFFINEEHLAMKSSEAGLIALNKFKNSKRTLQDVVEAYTYFYENKSYVKLIRGK